MIPTTESRVRDVIDREGFESDLAVSSKLVDDLGMESLDVTELALGLEEEFPKLAVLPGDEDEWITILDVVHYVDRHI
jgi:acyl carrier protein